MILFSGKDFVTTEFAPTIELLAIETEPMILAPEKIVTLSKGYDSFILFC